MFGWLKNWGQKLNNSYAKDNRFNSGQPNLNISSTPVRKTTAKPKTANQNLSNLGLSTSWAGSNSGQQSQVGRKPAVKAPAKASRPTSNTAQQAPRPNAQKQGQLGVSRGGSSGGAVGYSAPASRPAPAPRPQANSLQQEFERLQKAEAQRRAKARAEEAARRAAIKVPDRLNLQAFTPDVSQLGVYNPNFDALERAQQDILGSFGTQRDTFNKQAATQRQDLQQRMQQLVDEQNKAKQDSQRNFAQTRKEIQDSVFDAQRADQAAAASRGLADSGAAQLGEIQRKMAEGDALSQSASDYYDAEDSILRARKQTKENHDIAEQQVENSLAEAMSSLLGMETQQKSQYTNQMEALKRQIQEDTNALANAKNQWGQVASDQQNMVKQVESDWARQRENDWVSQQQADRAYQSARDQFMLQQASTTKGWEQQLAEFDFRKQQAAQQQAMAQQAQAAQASRWNQEFGLKQKQFAQAQQQASQQLVPTEFEMYDIANQENMTPERFQAFANQYEPYQGMDYEVALNYGQAPKEEKKKFTWRDLFGK